MIDVFDFKSNFRGMPRRHQFPAKGKRAGRIKKLTTYSPTVCADAKRASQPADPRQKVHDATGITGVLVQLGIEGARDSEFKGLGPMILQQQIKRRLLR